MKSKRILSFLLTFVMLCTSFGMVSAENTDKTAAAEETVVTPLDTDEFKALYAMGFLGDELLETDKTAYITRAQFIGYLFRLSGYTLTEHKTDDIPFVDVSTKTPYCNEICTMYKMGKVNGTAPNTFSPDAHVTYSQACKLIIDVLGYRSYAEIKYGEYPEGYVMMAGELDINDGVKNVVWNRELTAEDAVRMLYNAGRAEVFKFAGTDANGNPKYETDGTDLFATNDIFYAEGTMESNGISSIKEDEAVMGTTVISGEKYVSADTDLSNLLGCKVKYFYRDDEFAKKLLWAEADGRFSNVIDFKAEELAVNSNEYTMTNIVYYESDGKTDSVKINPLADVIYNNSRCGIPTIDDVKPMTGTMRLIDNNDDELYDVVIVNEYDNLFVTHIVEEKGQIFAKYNKAVYLEDYEDAKIIKDGKEVTVDEIDNQSVVSYVENKEKTKIYLYPVNESYKDVLKSVETSRGRKVYSFENGKYRLSNAYKEVIDNDKEFAVSPEIGKSYTFWVDIFGEIAEVQELPGSLQYALLMSVREGEVYEDCKLYIRLLLANNSKVTGAVEKHLIVNGAKTAAADFLTDTRLKDENGDFMVQVVQVAFDDEGMLTKLNFATDTQDLAEEEALKENPSLPYLFDLSGFSRDYRGTDASVRAQDSYYLIDNKYLVSADTVVFAKWHDMESSEPYEVVSRGTVASGTYLKDIYDVNEDMEIGAMYREGLYEKGSWQLSAMIVDNIDYVYSDDQEVKRLNGYMSGTYTSYVEEEPGVIPDTLERGDIVRVSVRNGKLNKTFMEVSAEEIRNKTTKVINNPNATPSYNSERSAVFAPLYRMNILSLTMGTPSEWQESVGSLLTSPKGNDTVPLTIYDLKNDEFYRGDFYEMYQKYTLHVNGALPAEANNVMVYARMRYVTMKEVILVLY